MTISMPKQAVCVRVVVPTLADARSIGVEMLNAKIAYSVSINSNIESHYIMPDGTVQEKIQCELKVFTIRSIINKTAQWLQEHLDSSAQISVYSLLDADDKYLDTMYSALTEEAKEDLNA